MKKIYVTPKVEMMEMETEVMMLSLSSGGSSGLDGTSWKGESEGGMEADASGRRGSWGDLWAEKE
jgi:hypothetical protein